MKVVYKRPELLTDAHFSYCGGCGHGIINKLLAEIIEEEKLSEKAILVWPIGCSVYADQNFKVDSICALHGRAPSVGTGLKRALPENAVIVYQGDGDLVSEGMAEIMHAAIRVSSNNLTHNLRCVNILDYTIPNFVSCRKNINSIQH
jgi:2-oxoglutarate ferredoxin oxidoreductase subunit beta